MPNISERAIAPAGIRASSRWLLALALTGVMSALVARLDENASAVLDERRILLEIEPVYGAYVLLLTASIEWLDPKRP